MECEGPNSSALTPCVGITSIDSGKPDSCIEDVKDQNLYVIDASTAAGIGSIYCRDLHEEARNVGGESVSRENLGNLSERINAYTKDVNDEHRVASDASTSVDVTSVNSGDLSGVKLDDGKEKDSTPEKIEDFTEDVKDRNKDIIDASEGVGVASVEYQDLNVGQERESFPCDVVHRVDVPETSDVCTGTVEDRNRDVIDVSACMCSSSINSVDLSSEAGNDRQEKEFVPYDDIRKLDVPVTIDVCAEDANDRNMHAINASAGGIPSINSGDESGEAGNDGQDKVSVPFYELPETLDTCTEDMKDRSWDVSDTSNVGSAARADTTID